MRIGYHTDLLQLIMSACSPPCPAPTGACSVSGHTGPEGPSPVPFRVVTVVACTAPSNPPVLLRSSRDATHGLLCPRLARGGVSGKSWGRCQNASKTQRSRRFLVDCGVGYMILSILNNLLRWSTLTGFSRIHLTPRFCIRKGNDENRSPAQNAVKTQRKHSVSVVFW